MARKARFSSRPTRGAARQIRSEIVGVLPQILHVTKLITPQLGPVLFCLPANPHSAGYWSYVQVYTVASLSFAFIFIHFRTLFVYRGLFSFKVARFRHPPLWPGFSRTGRQRITRRFRTIRFHSLRQIISFHVGCRNSLSASRSPFPSGLAGPASTAL